MQPLHNFQFLPWHLLFQLVASSRYQEEDPEQVESPPVSPPQSEAVVADAPQQDFPKGRRRKRNSSSAANVTTSEPVKTPLRRLRLKFKEAEKSEKKEKEEAVVVEKDYVAGFRELRSRKLAKDSQKIGQCSPSSVDPKAPSINGFSLSLSAKEIEEDFLLMTGKMPPRNPKKRKTRVQKSIKHLDLGTELGSVCAAAYEVEVEAEKPEEPEIPKKGRKRSL